MKCDNPQCEAKAILHVSFPNGTFTILEGTKRREVEELRLCLQCTAELSGVATAGQTEMLVTMLVPRMPE